jgi:hypothetical protein
LPTHFPDVFLQTFDSIVTDDKPKLEGSELLAQRNLPMLEGRKTFGNLLAKDKSASLLTM